MTLHHAPDDPPRVCWACIDDAVNAPDEPMPEHDPEIIGHDEDGPYCVCGHHVSVVTAERYALTITHAEPEMPTADLQRALCDVVAATLRMAGIRASVSVEPFGVALDIIDAQPCQDCGQDADAHRWANDISHTYDPKEA
jgi:hypothetical protein